MENTLMETYDNYKGRMGKRKKIIKELKKRIQ
jgi:hypothetical protein